MNHLDPIASCFRRCLPHPPLVHALRVPSPLPRRWPCLRWNAQIIFVVELNLAVEILEPRRLAETKELIVDEAVLHAVELINIVNNRTSAWPHKCMAMHLSFTKV